LTNLLNKGEIREAKIAFIHESVAENGLEKKALFF
jgi:hypothetical protein